MGAIATKFAGLDDLKKDIDTLKTTVNLIKGVTGDLDSKTKMINDGFDSLKAAKAVMDQQIGGVMGTVNTVFQQTSQLQSKVNTIDQRVENLGYEVEQIQSYSTTMSGNVTFRYGHTNGQRILVVDRQIPRPNGRTEDVILDRIVEVPIERTVERPIYVDKVIEVIHDVIIRVAKPVEVLIVVSGDEQFVPNPNWQPYTHLIERLESTEVVHGEGRVAINSITSYVNVPRIDGLDHDSNLFSSS